jgi:hypothetical protein
VSFTDADTGTVVGLNGTILRTTNGGVDWTNQSSGTTCGLLAVSFIDANTGIVVGLDGTILHTTNGGTTWTNQSSGTTNIFEGVCLTDANTGTAVGANGTILRTITGGVTTVKDNPVQILNQFALKQNYPNPFNPSTVITFTIPTAGNVTLTVYNSLGQEVATLINGYKKTQTYNLTFNGSDLASGVYIYTLKYDNNLVSKKMILMK